MKAQDQYLQCVRWSEEGQADVGYCADLFPAGSVCHGANPAEAYARLSEIVEHTVTTGQEQGLELPPASTRAMRDAVAA